MTYIEDDQFGEIVDFDNIRRNMRHIYDQIVPEFNLLGTMNVMTELFDDVPAYMIAAGASMLAYMMLPAAGEHELAEKLKGYIFTLGWTEEHSGSDLLSIRTAASPINEAERTYHIKGAKWMINNSFHADYHCVLAKIDPSQSGPRSLSLFLVPRSSTRNWQRLDTHVLRPMVLTKFEIDGPGQLLGKPGHGLSIVQRMAMPSKYQASYMGMRMVHHAIPETIRWLSVRNIFGENPVNFSNVFRQLYNLALQAAHTEFTYYRANALNQGSFLQFHGTMLKSFLLLRANEILAQNWLVAGSKGFTRESRIGRDAIDSFVLPVFDGHYTVNTLMTAKNTDRYVGATRHEDALARIHHLRQDMYQATPHGEMDASPRDIRRPDFFDYADYIKQLRLPINLNAAGMVNSMKRLLGEIETVDGLSSEPEYKYKSGDLIHWMESVLVACDMWKVTENGNYLNAIVQQYNGFVNLFNQVVSEGDFSTAFMSPMRQLPLPDNIKDPTGFLLRLCDIESQVREFKTHQALGAD